MSEQRPKLPKSILIINIIMILLILVICALAFSLAFSQINRGNESSQSSSVSETAEAPLATTAATTTTQTTTSVSMTKRSTDTDEQTEPVETQTTPAEVVDTPVVSTSYKKEFFAEDLFIGDSITTGLALYNKLDAKNVAAGVGFTPYKALNDNIDLADGTSATPYDYAVSMQPKRIYIMLGSNGLLAATSMEDSYKTLIEKLKANCPNSEIYCLSVTPITSDSSAAASSGITNQMVIDFNTYIQSISASEGVTYVDIYSLMCDSTGYFSHDYAEVDGMHFLGDTYNVMLSYIEKLIEA